MDRSRTALMLVFPLLLVFVWCSPLAHADAPLCRYETTANTVLDRTTKLTWERMLDGGLKSQPDASSYCSKLALAGGGWRLPTVKELQTLLDLSTSNPAADSATFPGIPLPFSRHWSSTNYAKDETKAWFVQFSDGVVYWKEVSDKMYVRCVK